MEQTWVLSSVAKRTSSWAADACKRKRGGAIALQVGLQPPRWFPCSRTAQTTTPHLLTSQQLEEGHNSCFLTCWGLSWLLASHQCCALPHALRTRVQIQLHPVAAPSKEALPGARDGGKHGGDHTHYFFWGVNSPTLLFSVQLKVCSNYLAVTPLLKSNSIICK